MSVRNLQSTVAVVGASTPDGAALRHALEVVGIPGARVDLYGTSQGEALISEYAGEARLIQEADLAEIVDHDLIFLCERGDLARGVAGVAEPGAVIIDLVDALDPAARPRLVHMDVNPQDAADPGGRIAVPAGLAIVIAEPLLALERDHGIEEATAIVLRPASDFGEPGIEELREQTTRLLSFSDMPTETFGRQLAFNVLPQSLPQESAGSAEARRVEDQVRQLLGWDRARLALRQLTVPIFHGHGIQLRLKLKQDPGRQALLQSLEQGSWLREVPEVSTPLDVCEESKTRVVELESDGNGGYWLWVVAGELRARGVEQAVRVAHAAREL